MPLPPFVIHLLSGGMDSTVMLYDLQAQGCQLHCALFDYGQRHQKELMFAKRHCERINVPFTILCMPTLQGSRLTGNSSGFVVPFRNPILLAMAVNLAAAALASVVTIACNADDHADFPDCRWPVMDALNQAIKLSGLNVEICAPYINKRKWEIVELGRQLALNMDDTWSCYAGGTKPCNQCPACRKRAAALKP